MKKGHFRAALVFMTAAIASGAGLMSPAWSADFYKNKRITFIIATGAGGSYDRVARMVARSMFRHIPGTPSIISQNMQGASSIKAANHIYNIAPQDGTVMAMVVQTLPQNQLLKFPNIKYDAAKFQWIGNPSSSVIAFGVRNTAPVKSIEDAKRHEIIFGASNRRGADGLLPIVVKNILGAKFKVVTGYKGGGAVMLAFDRGEIAGRGGLSWGGWKASRPQMIKDGTVRFILQVGLAPEKELPNVPLATDLAKTDEDRKVLRLFSTASALGYPMLTGQKVAAARVAILRRAFRDTMGDPVFKKEAEKSRIDIVPMYGEEVQKAVEELLNYSPAIVAKAKAAMEQ